MPNQDYISRKPTKKKSPKGSAKAKKNSAPAKATLPLKSKVIILVTLLCIGAFGYGLWALKTAPSTKVPVTEKPQTAPENEAKTLPEPPKEKWSYVKGLEQKEVEVGQYEVKEKGPYKMQCGSFRTQKQAEVLKANIAFAGLESTIQKVDGTNGTWYKVFLGPYQRKRLAEKDKHNLRRNNINHCQIWLWR
ncbi:SPOR domain-containing protein [Colwellia sp. D2M02]|uniref:SPOR domain-containing protein n=1 Tax=Colwellia asteriadis TaxID=517723 RepID=A0ABN1L348_9GAMM|nr:SPOR domain-containing protein [Colwellia sp. D2M02]MBU2893593.1 SPOR domain-containing protein [Colwellia sp. D2M02]